MAESHIAELGRKTIIGAALGGFVGVALSEEFGGSNDALFGVIGLIVGGLAGFGKAEWDQSR